MSQDVSDLDRRLTDIQSHISRLSLSLHLWRERQDRLQPLEQRLSQLTDQCSELVDRWSRTGDRQAQVLDRLEQRLKDLNRDATPSLDEVVRLPRPTARPSFDPLTLDDIVPLPPPRPATGAPDAIDLAHPIAPRTAVAAPAAAPAAGPSLNAVEVLTARIDALEHALNDAQEQIREGASRRGTMSLAWVIALLVMAAVGAWVFATRVQRQADSSSARAVDVAHKAEMDAASEQVTAARQDAARQIADAQASARTAQEVSNVLSAPDLVRFVLRDEVPGREGAVAAHALWSRSRGFVFSGSHLPVPPPDFTYQVWLMTNESPVPAGTFAPDDEGTFTVATPPPANVPLLTGISVTVEPKGGSEQPTGETLLAIN